MPTGEERAFRRPLPPPTFGAAACPFLSSSPQPSFTVLPHPLWEKQRGLQAESLDFPRHPVGWERPARRDRSLNVIPVQPLDAWQAMTPEPLRSKVVVVSLPEEDSGVPVHVPPEVVPQSVESVPRSHGNATSSKSEQYPSFACAHESSPAHSHPATPRQESAELLCSLT